jgi:uncharacterized protein HemX
VSEQSPRNEIQRSVLWLGVATVALFLVVLALAVLGWIYLQEQIDRNSTSLKALCFQRADVDDRIDSSQRLLAQHPHETLIFAIPRRLIESSLERDRRTRQNLAILDCKETP